MATYTSRPNDRAIRAWSETRGRAWLGLGPLTAPPKPGRASLPAAADDGDEFQFCSTCAFSAACLEQGFDKSRLRELHVLVEHIGPFAEGEHIFREGDPFEAIAAVRLGTVKTYVNDAEGREQVLGFFLPGEIIGLNAISQSKYPCNAVALDSVQLCRFSFPNIAELAGRVPGLQKQLFKLLSEDIGKAALLAGNFMVALSRRQSARGFSKTRLHLAMTRTDIANYLRLASESVSRGFSRLQDAGIVRVERREIEITDPVRLSEMARHILRE